jgi:tRNA(Ile)-lysidine synthase
LLEGGRGCLPRFDWRRPSSWKPGPAPMPAHKINWPDCAGRLAAALTREQLHPAVLAWAGVKPARRGPWAVAFSGGADSLALLLLLWAHWPHRREKLVALHFNHRLRGRESNGDEAFCRQVCRGLGVRYFSARWRAAHSGASEAEARTARFGFFERKLRAIGCRVLWLGHQQDDIAETMFMRLARGSGTVGLAAPRPLHAMHDGRVHLRPLLTLKKAQIAAGLRSAGGKWREDATNAGNDFFRNRIRRTVLPAWRRAAGRDAVGGIALSRELLEEDAAALEAGLAAVYLLRGDGALDLRKLAGKPRAIVRRALHRWLLARPEAAGLSRQGFASLLASVEAGRATRHSLGAESFAVIRRGHLEFERRRPARVLKEGRQIPRRSN